MAKQHKPILRPQGRFVGWEVQEKKRKHLEPPELARFFAAVDDDPFWCPYFSLQYFFGCRVSEPALIFEEDVHDGHIIIRRLKKRPDVHEGGFEIFGPYPLPAKLEDEIERVREYKAVRGLESAFLFGSAYPATLRPRTKDRMGLIRYSVNDDGSPCRAISRHAAHRRFKEVCEAAQLPRRRQLRRTHVLRHTRATLMFAAGSTRDEVQYLLGHSSSSTTQGYIHAARAMAERYNEKILAQGLEGFL